MVILESRMLLNLVLGLANMERYLAANPGVTVAKHEKFSRGLSQMSSMVVTNCERLRLQVAADAARGIAGAQTTDGIKTVVASIKDAVASGLSRRKFFEPESRYLEYFENPKLFGEQVFAAFPAATDDIVEAGTCLALERATACVMHLMRVAEVGLRSLARSVGLTQPSNDWGSCLRDIKKELAARSAATTDTQTPEEEFYREAAAQLDQLERAWRNPTMHVDKAYSQPRAEEILLATKAFMTHLATKISE